MTVFQRHSCNWFATISTSIKNLTNLKNKNVIKLGSKEMSLNKKNFINSFNRMMSSYKDRNLLSKNSVNLVDKKGSREYKYFKIFILRGFLFVFKDHKYLYFYYNLNV